MGDVPSRFVHGLSATDRDQFERLRRPRELATRVEALLLSAHRYTAYPKGDHQDDSGCV